MIPTTIFGPRPAFTLQREQKAKPVFTQEQLETLAGLKETDKKAYKKYVAKLKAEHYSSI